jgi:hypothetical protein
LLQLKPYQSIALVNKSGFSFSQLFVTYPVVVLFSQAATFLYVTYMPMWFNLSFKHIEHSRFVYYIKFFTHSSSLFLWLFHSVRQQHFSMWLCGYLPGGRQVWFYLFFKHI